MAKRILFIATSSMSSPSGGGLANKALYNALEERYPGCVDVVMQEDGCQYPDNFHMVKRPTLLKRIFNTAICKFEGNYGSAIFELLERKASSYSLCVINVGLLGNLVSKIQQRGLKVVTIHHNYEPEFQRDNKSPCTFWGTITRFVSSVEKKSYLESDMNLFLTNSDMERFEKVYGSRLIGHNHVIGIFETNRRDAYYNPKQLPANKLVICGSLCSVQTITGVKHFEQECLPVLRKFYDNNFNLTLTGRNPGTYISKFVQQDSHIILEANPQDISKIVEKSGIFICPTNVGGGIKLRIMDGLKLGLPVITHEVSSRGYDKFFNQEWFQIYNDKISFEVALKKIVKLIQEKDDLRQEILDNYYNAFSFSKGKQEYINCIEAIV